MRDTSILVNPNREGIAQRALDLLVDGLRAGTRQRGSAHLALTGGSSATALFTLLHEDARAQRVDWSKVHVWQGDERFVPLDHPQRNWAAALADWLERGDGVPAQLHPIPVDAAIAGGHDAAWAARQYADEVTATLPQREGIPAFDVLLLGVGSDGHILSTFPGTAAVAETRVAALAMEAPTHIEPLLPRVTLAPFLLRAAGSIIVMVPGGAKAMVIADCLGPVYDPARWPAQLALRPNAVWLLDTDCAAGL